MYLPNARVMGIDCSTNSVAFSLFHNKKLVRYGEVEFEGQNVFERLAHGQRVVRALKKELQADRVIIESAVYVQNKRTVILLSYAYGAIIAALIDSGAAVDEISPLVWQRAIGNPPLTKGEKAAIVEENPGRSKAWYSNANREFRKARTMELINEKYGTGVTSDNVSDAIAIGAVGSKSWE